MDRLTPGRAVLVISLSFLTLMILLPLAYPYGSFIGLDGSPGVIENWSKLSFADPVTRVVYGIGDLFCHQEQARSFIINGSEMAFCQRDVSILAGVAAGSIITDVFSKKIDMSDPRMFILGAILIASTIVEWGIEFVTGNDVLAGRVLTGSLAGIGIALVIQYAVSKQYDKVMGFGKEV